MTPARAALILLGLAGGSAIVVANLEHTEGRAREIRPGVYEAYLDTLAKPNVWTICAGITRGVQKGQIATDAECDELERAAVDTHSLGVASCIPSLVDQPAGVQAGIQDLAYNTGVGNVCRSSIPGKVARGEIARACAAIVTFNKAGGKNCDDPKNGCSGIPCRRSWERALCDGLNPPSFDVWQRTVCPSKPWWKKGSGANRIRAEPVALNPRVRPLPFRPRVPVPHVNAKHYHPRRYA